LQFLLSFLSDLSELLLELGREAKGKLPCKRPPPLKTG